MHALNCINGNIKIKCLTVSALPYTAFDDKYNSHIYTFMYEWMQKQVCKYVDNLAYCLRKAVVLEQNSSIYYHC